MCSAVSTIINHDMNIEYEYFCPCLLRHGQKSLEEKTKIVKRDSVGGTDSLWSGNQTGVSLNINCFILSSKEQLVATELIFVSHHFY